MKFTNLQYMVTGAGVENLEESSNKNTTNLTKVVVFSFGGRKYALEILELQEIIKIPKIAPLPGTSEYISGVTSLRGKVVVVLDLQKKIHPLNNDGVNYSRLAIVNVGGDLFGIMIESFVEILEISRETIKNNTSLLDLSAQRDCFKGVIAISNGSDLSMTLTKNDTRAKADNIIILLDLTKIVSSQDKEVTSVI